MTRKLCSVLLCAFALLLLMGAGVATEPSTVAGEETISAPRADFANKNKANSQAIPAAPSDSPLDVAEELAEQQERKLRIDGEYAPQEVALTNQNGVNYVALATMAQTLDSHTKVDWNADSQTVTVTTPGLTLTAEVGQLYLVANGRYLYLPDQVQMTDGRVMVPLWAVAEAFDATVSWDAKAGVVSITRGGGAIQSGDTYYDQNTLFWLSRIIYAESGNQPLEGQMSVGSAVMNRVGNPIFGETIEEVLAQKNQFSTYKGGRLADRTPNASSVIAAKLVMDGGVVAETEGVLYFDSNSRSWAARNCEHLATIGNHKFYG